MSGNGKRSPFVKCAIRACRVVHLLLFLLASAAASWAGERPFEACLAGFAEAPDRWSSSRCFFNVGRRSHRLPAAAARLRDLRQRFPDNYWLACALGHVTAELGEDGVEEKYLEAADGFAEQGDAKGEILALQSLHHYLRVRRRILDPQAQTAIDRAVEVAGASGDEGLLAEVQVTLAMHLKDKTQDLRGAYHLLREAEAVLFPEGSPYWQRICLQELGVMSMGLGRSTESARYFRRQAKLSKERGAKFGEAEARFGLALLLFEAFEMAPREEDRRKVVAAVEEALATARAAGHSGIQIRSHVLLGRLKDLAEAEVDFERCLELADSMGQPLRRAHCLRAIASSLVASDPRLAMHKLAEAEELVMRGDSGWEKAFTLLARVPLGWAALPEEEAYAQSLVALDAVEAIRELQGAEASRVGVLGRWHQPYYQLSGLQLTVAHQEPTGERFERALGALERVRARALLDRVAEPETRRASSPRLAEALRGKVEIQRKLLRLNLSKPERGLLLADLEKVELEETAARSAAGLGLASREIPNLNLSELQKDLGPERALLSFQLAPRLGVSGEAVGGSWLVVVSAEDARAYPLPDPHELEPMLSIFLGLLARRDGSEASAATRLYEVLLQGALEELSAEVRHLVIIPDGFLHRLPFATLRQAADAPSLFASFHLSMAPSITLWRSWVGSRPEPRVSAALVLADPKLPGMARKAAGERAWAFAEGTRLGALPHARREGRVLRRRIGGGTQLLMGAAASERFLKGISLSSFGLLHLAAHAVIDEIHPSRSAVVLSAGGEEEDGLLQAQEIADLNLSGKAVVLSACQGASGALLKGEGVMSLSRSFFQAGAHAVVGSLWPLRDDEAAMFFDAFYTRLSKGSTMAEALAEAQRDRVREGAPAAAWAGLVVLGDGDLRPLVPAGGGRLRTWMGLALFLVLAAGLAIRLFQ